MADLQSVVELVFRGIDEVSETSGKIAGNINASFSGLSDKISGVAQPFADLANKLLLAEAALITFGVVIGQKAVAETVKFQDSLYLVQKQLGDQGPTIEQARQDIEAFAAQYGKNANDVAQSMAGFLAAGNDYKTSADLVKTSTMLMIAGELDAQFSTDALTQSLAGFRVPAKDMAAEALHIGDVLNKIGDISSGKFEEIVQGFSRISPTAKDAGFSMEETAASVAALVDIFGSGEIASTALKSGLLSLLDPSKEAKGVLDKLGVATTDSNGALRSSKDIITDLAGKWGTLTDAQKQQTAAIVFGKDQAGAMSALMGGWGKVQDYVAQMLDKTTGATGSMAREVEGKLGLISASVAKTDEAWRQFLEHLGKKITDGGDLQGVIHSVGGLGDAFKKVVDSGGFDALLTVLKAQEHELSAVIDTIAQNLPDAFQGLDWSGLIDSFQGLETAVGEVFKALFGSIDLTTVDGLRSALQTVLNTIESLTYAVSGIVLEFKPFAAAIGEVIQNFNQLETADKINFGATLGGMKAVVDAGVGLGLVLLAIGEAGADMGGVLDRVFGGIKVGVNALQMAFDGVALIVVGTIAKVAEGMITIDDLNRKLRGQENAPKSQFRQELDDIVIAYQAVLQNAERNTQELKDGWTQATGEAGDKTKKLNETLHESREKLQAAGSAARNAGQGAEEGARGFEELKIIVQAAVDAAEESVKKLNNISIKSPEFKIDIPDIEAPEIELKLKAPDKSIFQDALSGIDSFRQAAADLNFGTVDFQFDASALKDADDAIRKFRENEGGYKISFDLDVNNGEFIPKLTADAKTLADGFKQLDGTVKTTQDGFKYIEDATSSASKGMYLLADGTLAGGEALDKAGRSFSEFKDKAGGASKEVTALQKAQSALDAALGSSGASVGKITDAFNQYMAAMGQSGKLTVDQFINLTKVTSDFKAKMEEIASNERIKNMEFAVNFKTAQLEADVKRVQAAFQSIDATVKGTGDLISDLFGNLVNAKDEFTRLEIKEQLDLENERRQKALDLQAKLVEAEIKRIEAQTDALNRGDALITIDGKGLQPELEAFMWKILEAIRIRANAEFSDYLLGLGVT